MSQSFLANKKEMLWKLRFQRFFVKGGITKTKEFSLVGSPKPLARAVFFLWCPFEFLAPLSLCLDGSVWNDMRHGFGAEHQACVPGVKAAANALDEGMIGVLANQQCVETDMQVS